MPGRFITLPTPCRFTPETNEAMALAFDAAWRSIGSHETALQDSVVARSRMAAAILRMADRGDVDLERMCAAL